MYEIYDGKQNSFCDYLDNQSCLTNQHTYIPFQVVDLSSAEKQGWLLPRWLNYDFVNQWRNINARINGHFIKVILM
jgi:hypothetical protein